MQASSSSAGVAVAAGSAAPAESPGPTSSQIGRFIDAAQNWVLQEASSGSAAAAVDGATKPFAGPGKSHTAEFVAALLQRLERMPVVAPLSTYMFVPKSLVKRYATLATEALEWWVREIESGAALHSPLSAKAATLYLKHLDTIIARDATSLVERTGVDVGLEHETSKVVQVVRARLQLLEQGQWLEAVDCALRDAEAAACKAAERRTRTATDDQSSIKCHMYEACLHKAINGDTRTAHRVLRSNGLHPPCPETVGMMNAKFVTDQDLDTLSRQPALVQRARRCKAPQVRQKLVSSVVGRMVDCKAAGTSAWRNSRLKAVVSVDSGLRALTRWTQCWVSGHVPDIMAREWRAVLGVPLRKGDAGQDVRPILIGEALMAVPAACLQEITRLKVTRLLQPTQFGVGVPVGAESMVLQGRALAAMCPHVAHASFDMKNAFGEISRAEVLEEVVAELPELAPFIVGLGSAGTPIYVASGAATWDVIMLLDGLFQEHCLSAAIFCLGLRRALRRFEGSMREVGLLEPGLQLVHIEHVDDILMNLPPSSAPVWLPC